MVLVESLKPVNQESEVNSGLFNVLRALDKALKDLSVGDSPLQCALWKAEGVP